MPSIFSDFKGNLLQILQGNYINFGPVTGYSQLELLNFFNNNNYLGLGNCHKYVADELYGGPYREGFYIMPFIYDGKHYSAAFSNISNYKIKVCLNSVSNCASQLPASITVHNWMGRDVVFTKEDFIEQFGNLLILDFKNYPEELQTADRVPLCIETSGQIKRNQEEYNIGIKWGTASEDPYYGSVPLIAGKYPYSIMNVSDAAKFGGWAPELDGVGGTDAMDLYEGYFNIFHEYDFNTWTQHGYYGNDIKGCDVGSRFCYLYSKEVVDLIIRDLSALGIDISYVEESFNAAARLSSCSLSGINSITPSFDSDTFTYTVTTSNTVIRVTAQGNSDTTYISYKLDDGTAQATIQPYLDHTFTGLAIGTHTIKITPEGPNSEEYTFNITVGRSEQTEPGQSDNVHHNEGGEGELVGDPIYIPENVYTGYGTGVHTYALDIKQFGAILDSFYKSSIWSTVTSLDMNNVLSAFLWPFKIDTTNAVINGGIYIGKTPLTYRFNLNLDESHAIGYELDGDCKYIYNFGNLEIPEYFGGFLDYEPYTKLQLFLPYCGIQSIKADDVIGHTVNLALVCDLTKGTGEYLLSINYTANVEGTPTTAWAYKYKWPCQIAKSIQITGSNAAIVDGSIIRNVGAAVSGAIMTGSAAGAIPGALGALHSTLGEFPGSSAGSQGDGCERYGPQQPYFIITRPDTKVPDDYNKNFGRPSLITKQLTEVSGFTQIPNPLIDCNCTQEEKDYIINALKEGVYI